MQFGDFMLITVPGRVPTPTRTLTKLTSRSVVVRRTGKSEPAADMLSLTVPLLDRNLSIRIQMRIWMPTCLSR